jgi:hypothetical protein
MFFMSGSQAQTFASTVDKMTDRIRELGPNPLKGESIQETKVEFEDEVEFRGKRLSPG